MRLLVTRPEPEAGLTAERLRAMGHEVLVAPMLEAQWLPPPQDRGPFAAVLFTSANAVRALSRWPQAADLAELPAFAVGARTGEAARAAGFGDVRTAGGGTGELVHLTEASLRPEAGRLLYPAATERAGRLDADLAAAGFDIVLVEAYRMRPAEALPPAVAAALRGHNLDGVLLYSARTAAVLSRLAAAAGLAAECAALPAFALSTQVADAFPGRGVHIAARPDEAALFALLSGEGTSAAGIR